MTVNVRKWEIDLHCERCAACGIWLMWGWFGVQVLWIKLMVSKRSEPIEPIDWDGAWEAKWRKVWRR